MKTENSVSETVTSEITPAPKTPRANAHLVMQVHLRSSTPSALPQQVKELANKLAAIHGSIDVARESSGTHLYCACPRCLALDGERELLKRHLAVNADKFLA